MDSLKAAYFAGLIDGEGTITLERYHANYRPSVSMTNTDLKLIEAMRDAFPVSTIRTRTPKKAGQKTTYEIRWSHNRALDVIDIVAPYLIAKRNQADLVLSWRTVSRRNGKYSETEMAAVHDLVASVRGANRRGVQAIAA